MAKNANAPGERQKFYFQFITTPTADTPGTVLLLHFDNRRYFFGQIAEGTQRACIQRGIGIKKVRNLFLTGPTTWKNMGGLIGMILTMSDVQYEEMDPVTRKRPKLNIYGGSKLMHSMACARRFVFRTGMPLQIHEADPKRMDLDQPSYTDDNIDVWSLPARRRGRSGRSSPRSSENRSQSPDTILKEQILRAQTVHSMFDSDWRKDRLVESRFDEVKLPALVWTRNPVTKELNSVQCATIADAPHLQPDSRVLTRNPWPASLVEELPPADNIAGSIAMSYIIRGKPQRGKFLPKKAKELGVPAGPDYARLTAGQTVTLENGTMITPEMVLADTEPGKGMAILDVPTGEYLEDLMEQIQGLNSERMEGIETIAWLLGENVAAHSMFVELVQSLPGVQHIVSSPDTNSDYLALDSAAASSIRLAQICPECFKIPVHDLQSAALANAQQSWLPAERGLKVQIAPKFLLSKVEIPELLDIEATKDSYREVLRDLIPVTTHSTELQGPHDDVQILTLGTGSAVPSKYRNVSGTLVRIPNNGSYLFDCGENTLGMLRRSYSGPELDEVLVDLRMIWISHLHADHHLGTLSIIEAKKKAMQRLGRTEPKLYVVSEPNMADYLNDFGSVQSSSHCELLGVLNSSFVRKNRSAPQSSTTISRTSLPIKEFLTTRVSHCHGAQACSITFSNGFKFSYSGDCRPSAQFAEIGLGSDVLLHEATFDDGLEGDAMAKKHSTTAEALAVAFRMKAKNIILTHFSQRYQKIPVLNNVKFGEVRFEEGNDVEEAGPIEDNTPAHVADQTLTNPANLPVTSTALDASNSDAVATLQKISQEMNVCVAFDLMSITVGQIKDMYKYYPAIEKMFELEQGKSEAKKEERREENERMREAKENSGKKKPVSTQKLVSTEASADNAEAGIYQRINRGKVKGAKDMNGSASTGRAGEFTDNNTGVSSTSTNASPPILSKRASKRLLRKQQTALERQTAQSSMSSVSVVKVPADSEPSSKVDLTRQMSAESEVREAKRTKLDDQEIL